MTHRGTRAVQKGEWVTLDLPFEDFQPVFRAKVQRDAPQLDPSKISSAQFMLSKFEYDGVLNPSFSPGLFELPIAELSAYLPHACPPRFVHISSAGVTRPNRPGAPLLPLDPPRLTPSLTPASCKDALLLVCPLVPCP